MSTKNLLITLGILMYLFGIIWLFNHVNPWLALGLLFLGLLFLNYKISNKIKSK